MSRRGFTIVEALVGAGALMVGGALVSQIPTAVERESFLVKDQRNMRLIGQAGEGYGLDNEGKIFTFDWEPGVRPVTQWDDLADFVESLPPRISFGNAAATAQQAAIVRDMTGRVASEIPRAENHIAYISFNHLVLADRMGSTIPNRRFVSPDDQVRLEWQDVHDTFLDNLPATAPQNAIDGAQGQWRWPYSSSYVLTQAAYAPDSVDGDKRAIQKANFGPHDQFITQGVRFGGRLLSEVAFPAQKVWMHDPIARHFGPQTYHAYENATALQLFFDGSAGANPTANANQGWFPNVPSVGAPCSPTQIFPTQAYTPDNYEPPTQNGEVAELVNVYYEQTRSGLKGVDFFGEPIDLFCPPERVNRKRGWWTGRGGVGGATR